MVEALQSPRTKSASKRRVLATKRKTEESQCGTSARDHLHISPIAAQTLGFVAAGKPAFGGIVLIFSGFNAFRYHQVDIEDESYPGYARGATQPAGHAAFSATGPSSSADDPSLDGRRGRVIRVSADKNSMPHGLRCLVHPDSQKQEFREGRL